MTTTRTPLKKTVFTMAKVRSTGSEDKRLDGSIPIAQTQTPMTHAKLMSPEERRLTIRMINGMLKNGITTAEIRPRVLNTAPRFSARAGIQQLLPEADVLGRHFHKLVRLDKLDRLLQGELPMRREDDGVIAA